ncbi:DUF2125 domain-containing protein [Caulobacter sp. KR2-114]|uniref:DUF2125 domain-containing protein n=1 Tax=Caulobacter sp. KR2-114 TaxID=3400912 RepID=UPI003C107452
MTLPDPSSPRKVRRTGLYVPYAIAVVLAVGWCGAWFWIERQAEQQMDAARARLTAGGYPISWTSRRIDGFPFRLDLHLTGVRIGEPSGWGLELPRLEAEANAYDPGHWILAAPQGATFTRPRDGGVAVQAKVLRASVSHFGEYPPRLSVQGEDLTFAAAPGARPYFVSAAKGFDLHLRAGPGDQGAVYVGLDQAQANLTGLMARIAQGKPVGITADAIFSNAAEFRGGSWPTAVDSWRRAGGRFQVRQLTIAAGESILDARSGVLSVSDVGRVSGSLNASLRQAPQALGAMGEAGRITPAAASQGAQAARAAQQGDVAHMVLDFQDGQTKLGPVVIGPAPRVF